MERPLIGITIGDPAGIGPEIAVKSLKDHKIYEIVKPLLIGDKGVIQQALQVCEIPINLNVIDTPAKGLFKFNVTDVIDLKNVNLKKLEIGKVQAIGGKAAFEFVEKAVQLALNREIDAIATAPINKESLKAARINYIGHTEILSGLTGIKDPLTMFEVNKLRVFFLTRHMSLRDAINSISKNLILDYIGKCIDALKNLGVKKGVLAVCGLNPHCGENGLFGNEENIHITPAVLEAQKMGYSVEGPIGADSVFHLALKGKYCGVLSLYHDQGHIAAKTFDFEKTISLTLGLPFLRTSVDHGTAFDIAGTGKASEISLKEAIIKASKYALSYNKGS